MIYLLVILTPILLLLVVALLGFVGCNQIFGIKPTILAPTLSLSGVEPNFGPSAGGTAVKVFGAGLTDTDQVIFGTAQASMVTDVNDGEVDAITPPNSAGPVNVTISQQNSVFSPNPPLVFTYIAIGFVQTVSNSQPVNPPISVSLTNTTQGNLLIAAVTFGATGSVTVADNLNNPFTLAGSGPWLGQSRLFYLPNIPGGNVTITATGTGGAGGPCNISVSEYSGADPSSAAVYGFSTKASLNAGTAGLETMRGIAVSPAQAGDIVCAVVFASRPTPIVAGPGFTPHPSTIASVLVEDNTSAVTATQTVATTDTTGGGFAPWVILAVAIKA